MNWIRMRATFATVNFLSGVYLAVIDNQYDRASFWMLAAIFWMVWHD